MDLQGATPTDRREILIVEALAREAGALALDHFKALAALPVQEKGHLDLVTEADIAVEAFLHARLGEAFPADGFYGEENGAQAGRSGRTWVIDPIDGTFNFVRGSQDWAISIGLYENRQPVLGVVYAPARDLMLSGGQGRDARLNGHILSPLPPFETARGSLGIGVHPSAPTQDRIELMRFMSDELHLTFRCCGSSAISLLHIATGESDGYVAMGDSTWDVMAGLPILSALGAAHTIDWERTELQDKLRFACGRPGLVEKARPLLARIGGGLDQA